MPFIEISILSDETESTKQFINIDCIGRVYPNPQSDRKCIVELSYQSTIDSPVFLEVQMAYETVKNLINASQRS